VRASVAATPESLAALHALLADFWRQVDRTIAQPPTDEQRAQFATAIGEIAGNIIRYAYADRPAGTLSLRLQAWADRLEAGFTDQGQPYIPAPVLPPRALDDLDLDALPEGGFGLALARAALDQLDYRRTPDGDNHWTLISLLDDRRR
jgi:anti-sigma regulatory factor (Ser/Thr protein kinase)